eukprot:3542154-Rhodomonas_salina.4
MTHPRQPMHVHGVPKRLERSTKVTSRCKFTEVEAGHPDVPPRLGTCDVGAIRRPIRRKRDDSFTPYEGKGDRTWESRRTIGRWYACEGGRPYPRPGSPIGARQYQSGFAATAARTEEFSTREVTIRVQERGTCENYATTDSRDMHSLGDSG